MTQTPPRGAPELLTALATLLPERVRVLTNDTDPSDPWITHVEVKYQGWREVWCGGDRPTWSQPWALEHLIRDTCMARGWTLGTTSARGLHGAWIGAQEAPEPQGTAGAQHASMAEAMGAAMIGALKAERSAKQDTGQGRTQTDTLTGHERALIAPWQLLAPGTPSAQAREAAAAVILGSARPETPWHLFVDDEREPGYLSRPDLAASQHVTDVPWVIARDQWQAQAMIALWGLPQTLSFDHDYGEEALTGDGHGLAKWLKERHLDGLLDLRTLHYQVHSANPRGRENTLGVLDDITRFAAGDGSSACPWDALPER